MLWSEGMCSAGEIILRARGYHISHSILMLADLSFMVCSASVLAYARGPCVRTQRGSRNVARPGRLSVLAQDGGANATALKAYCDDHLLLGSPPQA